MAKSKPIGVRFDIDRLDIIQGERGLKTAQQVVNFLMGCYFGDFDNPGSLKIPAVEIKFLPLELKQEPPVILHAAVKSPDFKKTRGGGIPEPVRFEGEGTIDFGFRKGEWRKLDED